MWDFIKYLDNLLYTAFINPENWFAIAFGWVSIVWAIFSFVKPKWWLKMNNKVVLNLKKYRYPILSFLVIASLIAAAYTIQINTVSLSDNRPILTFSSNTEVDISTDIIYQEVSGDVNFHIKNVGNIAAYQTTSIICYAPTNNPQNILSYNDIKSYNPVQPQDEVVVPTGITQQYTLLNDSKLLESTTWYIYYQISYSDSKSNGNWYSDEYYFVLDFNKSHVRDVTTTERQVFQEIVNAFYSN